MPISLICAWSMWTRIHGSFFLELWVNLSLFKCLFFFISAHLGDLLIYSFEYPGHQTCNFNLLCVAVAPQCTSSCILVDMSFLKVLEVLLCLHWKLCFSLWLVFLSRFFKKNISSLWAIVPYISAAINFLVRYIDAWLSWDMLTRTACSLASMVSVTSFFQLKIFITFFR